MNIYISIQLFFKFFIYLILLSVFMITKITPIFKCHCLRVIFIINKKYSGMVKSWFHSKEFEEPLKINKYV